MFFKDDIKPAIIKDKNPFNEARLIIDSNNPLAIKADCIVLFDGRRYADSFNYFAIKNELIKNIILISQEDIERELEACIAYESNEERLIRPAYNIFDSLFKLIHKLGFKSAVIPYAYFDSVGIRFDSMALNLLSEQAEKNKLELHLCIGYKFKRAVDGRLREIEELEGSLKHDGNLERGIVSPIIKYLGEPRRLELAKKSLATSRDYINDYFKSSDIKRFLVGKPFLISKLYDREKLLEYLRELSKEMVNPSLKVDGILEVSMNLIFLLAKDDAYLNDNAIDREYIIDSLIASKPDLERISHLVFSPRVLSHIRNGSRGVKKSNLFKLALYGELNLSTLLELMTMYGYGFSPLYNLDRLMFYYLVNSNEGYLDIIDFIEVCSNKDYGDSWVNNGKKALEELNLGSNDLIELENNNNLVE